MKLLLVNTAINSTSTGRIAEEIGRCAQKAGYEVFAGYGFKNNGSALKAIKIGSKTDHYLHALLTRLTDRHGFGSAGATKEFIRQLNIINPDIINLHNIHGYYLNIPLMADWLKRHNRPVVWTFHDCWPFTGHCAYFDAVGCGRWTTGCHDCPNSLAYPSARFHDNSRKNFIQKKELFNSIPQLTVVVPCQWMADNVSRSFLNGKRTVVIYNGVNTDIFRPASADSSRQLKRSLQLEGKRVILGVASVWDKRKGLDDFKKMASLLHPDERIVLIGLDRKQIASLPDNIIGISRTENTARLAEFYSMADTFVNPTYVDNFPTTNIEALACGTPVVTYNTGGSPEAVSPTTGAVVAKGDVAGAIGNARRLWAENPVDHCRRRAVANFDSRDRFNDYTNLFNELCTTIHSDQN